MLLPALLLLVPLASADWAVDVRLLEPLRSAAESLRRAAILKAQARCFRLPRLVESRRSPGEAFRHWNDQTSYVSEAVIPNIHGIMTPFTNAPLARNYWLDNLKLSGTTLEGDLSLEATEFPLGSAPWRTLWKRRSALPLDKPLVLFETLGDRQFRVTMTLAEEPDRTLCRLPAFPL